MTGATRIAFNVRITPDGDAYFYRFYRQISDLYLVEGLK